MTNWLSARTQRESQQLVKSHCASLQPGTTNCLICPLGQAACFYFRELDDGQQTQRCRYFEEAVLPNDPTLEVEYQRQLFTYLCVVDSDGQRNGKCLKCRKPITKRSNNHLYCDDCKVIAERESHAKRKKRYRQRKK